MPLMKRPSKKAFEHNVKAEMHAGKPQDQSLAIAYSVKRKAKKKMADGGEVNAKNQRRPMPDNTYDDAKMVSRNRGNKPSYHDSWTDNSTVDQAQANDNRGKRMPIKRPRMVPSDAFSTRLYDEEGNLQESTSPGPYDAQPESWMDENDAKKEGKSPDMADEHSTHRKPYAKGGEVESQDYEHPDNKYEHGKYNEPMQDDTPSEDEGDNMAMSRNEMDADMEGSDPDMEREHSNGRMPYADGGEIGRSQDDSEDQPQPEEDEERHASITAAIMARRERLHAEIDSGAHDMDAAVRMAEGGRPIDEILSHDSIYSDDSDQADLSRNHDEDANEEDQLSWNALRRENYNSSNLDIENPSDSGQMGDEEESDSENQHDMIGSIRSKMKARRQFKGK